MFETYQHFSATDFAADDRFVEWVKKAKTAPSAAFWRDFLAAFPGKQTEVEQARQLVLALSATPDYAADDAAVIWARLEENMQDSAPAPRSWRIWHNPLRWVAAATVALLVGFLWKQIAGRYDQPNTVAVETKQTDTPGNEVMQETIHNNSTQNKTVALPDGSRVTLLPNTRLRFARKLDGVQREVTLTGTAFFEVKHDPERPFLVYSGDLVTKVLGTSFWVRANASEKKIIVSVRTGRVSVFSNVATPKQQGTTAKPMVLTPNQQAIFDAENQAFSYTLVEQPVLLLEPKELEAFVFKSAPVGEIFAAIERAYGVDVEYDATLLANCTLTTSLKDETLFEKLAVICKALDLTYKVEGTRVLVIGTKGCE
jgi:transmembrane sensor